MSQAISYPAPAKLNLMLRILGRREDGYHNLQTVFQFIDRYDQLNFRVREDGRISLGSDLNDIPKEDNLCYQAAKQLKSYSGTSLGADITLHKILPIGGGLGGGSSNAATTLVALNHLWKLNVTNQELQKIGLSLGADVPIFVHGRASWAEGVGEIITDITLPEHWYLVIQPPCHVSTAKIFCHPDLTRHSPRIKIRAFLHGNNRNDCLDVVRGCYPKVAEAIDWLSQHAQARLTGTGACLFAQFAEQQQAQEVLDVMPQELEGFVARGLNCSPLRSLFQAEKH
jgi:4-diphosphocytidyl-2-C-methyl-D-erythritol kinase